MASNADLIIRLRADQQELRKDLARAKSQMQRFNGQMRGIGQQIRGTIAASFGFTALAFALGSSIRKIADFEFQMKKVQAVTGDFAGKEIPLLIESARQLGATTRFTATEIGKLQEVLAKRGFGTQEILDATSAISDLAIVADVELSEAAGTLAGTLRSFNLDAKESGRVANVMAESFSKSALDAAKFEVSMANVGSIAKNTGRSLEQTTALIAALVDANIDASKAGTDLRKIFIELAAKGMTLEDALSQIRNSQDKVTTAVGLFGLRAANAAVILSEQTAKTRELTGELADSNIELQKQVDIIEDSLINQWKLFTSAIDGVIQRGGKARGFFRDLLEDITRYINAFGPGIGGQMGASLPSDPFNFSFDFKEINKQFNEAKRLRERFEASIQEVKDIDFDDAFDNAFDNLDILTPFKEAVDFEGLEELTDQLQESLNMDFSESTKEGIEKTIAAIKDTENALQTELDILNGIIKDAENALQTELDILNGIIDSSLKNAIAAFAEGLGTGSIERALAGMLNAMASGLEQFGKLLIAQGFAIEAFRESLKSLTGVPAIIAGGALVAAAAAVKGYAGSLASKSSGGGGGFSGGGFAGSATGQSIQLNGQFIIRGEDLAFVLDQHNQNSGRRQGG